MEECHGWGAVHLSHQVWLSRFLSVLGQPEFPAHLLEALSSFLCPGRDAASPGHLHYRFLKYVGHFLFNFLYNTF